MGRQSGLLTARIPLSPSTITLRASAAVSATNAIRPQRCRSTCSRTHSAPLRVFPKPRPAKISHTRQFPSGASWLGCALHPLHLCGSIFFCSRLRFTRKFCQVSGGCDASQLIGDCFVEICMGSFCGLLVHRDQLQSCVLSLFPSGPALQPENRHGRTLARDRHLICRFRYLGVGLGRAKQKLPAKMLAQRLWVDAFWPNSTRDLLLGDAVSGHYLDRFPLFSRGFEPRSRHCR